MTDSIIMKYSHHCVSSRCFSDACRNREERYVKIGNSIVIGIMFMIWEVLLEKLRCLIDVLLVSIPSYEPMYVYVRDVSQSL